MKKLVGYGFSLPSKPSLFHIGSFDLLGFLFDGRLKPYPTEFCILEGKERGRSPYGFYFMRMFVNGALENSTLRSLDEK
jgi:hypothetical protein